MTEAAHIKGLLNQNTEEMRSILRALNGEFIEPQAGGDLLRDGSGVLPTGRLPCILSSPHTACLPVIPSGHMCCSSLLPSPAPPPQSYQPLNNLSAPHLAPSLLPTPPPPPRPNDVGIAVGPVCCWDSCSVCVNKMCIYRAQYTCSGPISDAQPSSVGEGGRCGPRHPPGSQACQQWRLP